MLVGAGPAPCAPARPSAEADPSGRRGACAVGVCEGWSKARLNARAGAQGVRGWGARERVSRVRGGIRDEAARAHPPSPRFCSSEGQPGPTSADRKGAPIRGLLAQQTACLRPPPLPQVLAGGSDQRARDLPEIPALVRRALPRCGLRTDSLPAPAAPFCGPPPRPLPAPLRGRLSPPSGAPALCQVPGDPCPREGPVPGRSPSPGTLRPSP